MNSILKLSHITKRFGPVTANEDVSFSLAKGEIVALLGENGAGKTTLMSILFGHYMADEGNIEAFGRPLPQGSPRAALDAGVGMVHQHFTLAGNMSVLDNIMLGTESLWALKAKVRSGLAKLEQLMDQFGLAVNPKALVKDLSVGEQQRVEILKVLYRDAKILILDEPTAVLTPQESDALFDILKQMVKKGLSIIFITHKMREVMAASDRCIVLRQGRVVFESPTDDTDPKSLARAMVGQAVTNPVRQRMIPGNPVLSLQGVTLKDPRGKKLLDNVDLRVRACEIIGIAGVSGNGQSQLADLVSGLVTPARGQMCLFSKQVKKISPKSMIRQGVGRVPDDRNGTGLISEMSVMENMASEVYKDQPFSSKGLLRFGTISAWTQKLVKQFDVRCPDIHTPVRLLSGGNMQKLILARELSGDPGIILANQPTWGLDVGATAYVHSQLMEAAGRGAGILIISEDLDELFALADFIQVMAHGRLSVARGVDDVGREELGLMMTGHLDQAEDSGRQV